MGRVIGTILVFIGVISFVGNLGEKNSNAAVGGFFISIIFIVLGVLAFRSSGWKCPYCAEGIKKDAKFCKHCGKAVGK